MESATTSKADAAIMQQYLEAQQETIAELKKRLAILEADRLAHDNKTTLSLDDEAIRQYVELCNRQINALKAKYKQRYADTVLKCQQHDAKCQESVSRARARCQQLEGRILELLTELQACKDEKGTFYAELADLRSQLTVSSPATSQRPRTIEDDYARVGKNEAALAELYHSQQLDFAAAAADDLRDGVRIPVSSPKAPFVAGYGALEASGAFEAFEAPETAKNPQRSTYDPQDTDSTYLKNYTFEPVQGPLPAQSPRRAVSPGRAAKASSELRVLLQIYPRLAENRLFQEALRPEIAARRDVAFCVRADGKVELLYLDGKICAPNLYIYYQYNGFYVILRPGIYYYNTCFVQITSANLDILYLTDLGLKHVFVVAPKLYGAALLAGNPLEVAICEQCQRLQTVAVDAACAGAVFAPRKTLVETV